jgi:hypothetical protein
MGLSFRNDAPDGLDLAFLMWDPDCGSDGQPFRAHGWYRISPHQTVEVCGGDVGDWHRWWGYYAISDTGRFWAGEYGMAVPTAVGVSAEVPPGSPPAAVSIGFRGLLMDDDYDNYLVPLGY